MVYKYAALFRRSVGIMLEYRVSMLIWMLTASFPLVMMAVWLTLAQDGPVGNYAPGDFVAYYLLALYVRMMTAVWVAWELDHDIRHGELAIKLLHPLNPIHDYVSFNLADKVLRFLLITPLILLAARLVPDVHLALTPVNVILFFVALAFAWLLRYITDYTVGLLSFWLSQVTTLQEIIWMLLLLLGGTVAPIDLLPGWLAAIAKYLPFRFMLSFPVEIMLGRLSAYDLLTGLLVSLAWLALFQALHVLVWRRGIRAFSAYGA